MAGQKTDERDVHLGRRIAEHRKVAKLTQRTVAKTFGMSAAQLQKYEKGTNRISAIHLGILSRLTGVPVASFLEGIPHLDDGLPDGFSEPRQEPIAMGAEAGPLAGLASAVSRHVQANFNERDRREIAAFADILSRELND